MKKIVVLILAVCVLFLLTACFNEKETTGILPSDESSNKNQDSNELTIESTFEPSTELTLERTTEPTEALSFDCLTEKETTPMFEEPPPTDRQIYENQTYQELIFHLLDANEGNSLVQSEQALYGEKHQKLLEAFKDGEIVLKAPKMNGALMPLWKREGFSKISIFTRETYHLPWIWYYCLYKDQNVRVQITYPTLFVDGIEDDMTCSQILDKIFPGTPTEQNYEKNDIYLRVYAKALEFKDKTVSATVYEFTNDSRIWIRYYDDGCLVTLVAEPSVFDDEFWSSFVLDALTASDLPSDESSDKKQDEKRTDS